MTESYGWNKSCLKEAAGVVGFYCLLALGKTRRIKVSGIYLNIEVFHQSMNSISKPSNITQVHHILSCNVIGQ